MSRAQRTIVQDNVLNRVKVYWPFNTNDELAECPHKDKVLNAVTNITAKDLTRFKDNVNTLAFTTMQINSPLCLRIGGFVVAIFVMIIGAICLSQKEVVVGALLVILGICFAVLGFWYRGRLIDRSWKKIGQGLVPEFKRMAKATPGISCEFHVQGSHRLNAQIPTRKKKRRKKKGLGDTIDHTEVEEYMQNQALTHRYIILYLPGDASHFHDYVEDRRSVTQIVKGDSAAIQERVDYVDDTPLVLPYWWSMKKSPEDGRPYFINNLKHKTFWNPPTLAQIEMEREELEEVLAPPKADEEEDSSESEVDDHRRR